MSDFKAKMHQIVCWLGLHREGRGPPALPLHPTHYILDKGLVVEFFCKQESVNPHHGNVCLCHDLDLDV